MPSQPYTWTPITSIIGKTIGEVTQDYRGISVKDADGNLLFHVRNGELCNDGGWFTWDIPYTRADGTLGGKYAPKDGDK